MELFTALLKEEVPTHSSIVPALIIPKGYPNQRTWELLRRVQDTELTGSLLTCRLDFSPEWRTYYDYRLAVSVEWEWDQAGVGVLNFVHVFMSDQNGSGLEPT